MALIIGIDIGGTNLRVGVVACHDEGIQTTRPRLLDEMRFQADFSGLCKAYAQETDQAWREILKTIAQAVTAVRVKYPAIAAVGIGFPGFIDPVTQTISLSPNLPGLHQVDLSADLASLIALPVITENDALAAAYGEYAAADYTRNNLVYLGLGTGVGGGLILNQKPYQGQHGVAMEVGHIIVDPGGRLCGCGNRGCMEQYASASGLSITYQEMTGKQCSAAEIACHAHAGDIDALAAFALAGESLAKAVAHILKVIDVPDIVIGGGMSAAWAYLQPAFDSRLDSELIPVLRGKIRVRISAMDDQAGIIGAAMLAAKQL